MKENGGRKRMERRDGEEERWKMKDERWKKSKDKERLKIEEWIWEEIVKN